MNQDATAEQTDLAWRITFWRESAGLRKIDLARAVGVGASAVTKWESASAMPAIEMIHAIAAACGVELRIFFGDLHIERRQLAVAEGGE